MTFDRPSSETENNQPSKKPYAEPKLVQYGNIREITKAVGGVVGKNDGGSGKDKTG